MTGLTRRSVVGTILSSQVIGGAGIAALAHADEDLLALGRELDAAWLDERLNSELVRNGLAPPTDDAYDRTASIVKRICAVHANTVDGLRVKAKAISWCHAGDAVDMGGDHGWSTDVRIAHSILADLGIAVSEVA